MVKLLEQTGFTTKEAEVYLALLELSAGTVTEVATVTKLKRSIIYVLLEGLVKRGYVSELPNKKISVFQALDPSVILFQLKMTTKNFGEMLPIFRTLHNKGKRRPNITYHETKEGIWKVYEEMTMTTSPSYISSYSSLEKMFPGSVKTWIKNKKRLKFADAWHLIPNDAENIAIGKKFAAVGEKVRILEVPAMNMDFTVFGNKLAITSLENEPFIVVMESAELAQSMLALFRLMWKGAREFQI